MWCGAVYHLQPFRGVLAHCWWSALLIKEPLDFTPPTSSTASFTVPSRSTEWSVTTASAVSPYLPRKLGNATPWLPVVGW